MKELFAAMSAASAEIEGAQKDSNNPHFKTKYADLSSVVAAIKPALTKQGLWFRQVCHERDKGVCVETYVCHKSGEEISFGSLYVPASKQDAQGFGSALTYCRRYSLMTAFGVCPEDDDGNAAVAASRKPDAKREETAKEMPSGPINDKTRDWLAAQIVGHGHNVASFCKARDVGNLKDVFYEDIAGHQEWLKANKKEVSA